MSYDYFYGQQADQFSFYRIPKALFTDEAFDSISIEAKLLYGILLDRMNLSAKNGWLDKEGRVHIIFTIDEVKESLRCSNKKAAKTLDELENTAGLIERRRRGLGKPNLLYVKNFISRVSKGDFLKFPKETSGCFQNRTIEFTRCSTQPSRHNSCPPVLQARRPFDHAAEPGCSAMPRPLSKDLHYLR